MEVSMSGKRYTEQFKVEAVKQITEHGHSVGDVAKRLGVTPKSLHDWKARYGSQSGQWQKNKAAEDEVRALKAEVKRLTMERDILKEAAAFFAVESKKNTRS
jgi:transposase|tara:strand:- start:876 stop:1181 length:306 start_codon:yes stop_codon:yes gene_type:complete